MMERRLQPEIIKDKNGKITISSWSFVRGNFRRILRLYQNYLIDCFVNIEEPLSFIEFYKKNRSVNNFLGCKALDLYLSQLSLKK